MNRLRKTKRTAVTVDRYNMIFDELKRQQIKNGYVKSMRRISNQFGASNSLGSELIRFGIIKKIGHNRYNYLPIDKSSSEVTKTVLNERKRKNIRKEKNLLTLNQQTMDFKENEEIQINKEIEEKLKKAKPIKNTIKKFFNTIWELLKTPGELKTLSDINKIKNANKIKHSVVDALEYAGVIKKIGEKYLIISNYNNESHNEWSEKAACYHSGVTAEKYRNPKKNNKTQEIEVVQEVKIENKNENPSAKVNVDKKNKDNYLTELNTEDLDFSKNEDVDFLKNRDSNSPKKERNPTPKNIYELENYMEKNKFFTRINVDGDKLLTNKLLLINYVSGFSNEEYEKIIKLPINIISFIKIICEINNEQELKKFIRFVLTEKELQK